MLSLGLGASFANAAEKISYQGEILPIFRDRCLNCHNPDKLKAGLDLTTYEALMRGSDNSKVIDPGNPGNSLLFKLITHSDEPAMPPKSDKLPDVQIELIRKWIEHRAPEGPDSAPVAAANNANTQLTFAAEQSSGPPPIPHDLVLEPVVRTERAGMVVSLAASPRAPIVALAAQKQVLLYDTNTLELAGALPFPEGFPDVVKFSRDGILVIAGGGVGAKSGRVVAWDVRTGERVLEAGDEFDVVLAADISADHHLIALGGPNRIVKIFTDGKLSHRIKKHTDWVTALAFTPDGKLLISGDRQGGLSVWETATGTELFTLPPHKGGVTALSAPTPQVCASASEDGMVNLWDLREGKLIKNWEAHKGGTLSLAFAPDGRLVTCGRDKLTRLWDGGGNKLREFEPLKDVALSAAICQDKVVASDWTGTIRVWNADGKRSGDLNPNPATLEERIGTVNHRIAELESRRATMLASLVAARDELTSARRAIQAKQLPSNAVQAKAAEEKLSKAKREAEAIQHDFFTANCELAKWKAAQINVTRFAARGELAARQRDYARVLDAAAKVSQELQKAREDLAKAESGQVQAPGAAGAASTEIEKLRVTVNEIAVRTAPARSAARKAVYEASKPVAAAQLKVNALSLTYEGLLRESARPIPLASAEGIK